MCETWVQSLDWEDPLEKGKATHSSRLAWRIRGLYSPWGHKESQPSDFHFLSSKDVSSVALVAKNPTANAGDIRDTSSIPGLGRSPGGGHGNPLQYSCLENLMDRAAWQTTVHKVANSQTRVK